MAYNSETDKIDKKAVDGLNIESNFTIMMNRVNSGTKAWARCKCPGQNTATLSFYFGIHEYVG